MTSLTEEPVALDSDWSDRGASERLDRAVRTWAAAAPTAVWLALIVTAAATVRLLLALEIPAPWIIPDELIYSELAKSFAATGHFAVRDMPFSAWSFGPLYPVLISPAYRLAASVPDAYVLVKAINAVSMSLAAVPGYLLARRLVSRRSALMASVFAVLVPSAVYTTKVMTENVSYPIFLFAVLAMIRTLERPSARRQLVVLALILVAVLARAQMIVLFPAFLTAVCAVAMLEERRLRPAVRRALNSFRLTWGISLVGIGLPLALELSRAGSREALLGGHEALAHRISLLAVPQWFLYHLAEIDLYSGVIPFAVFFILLIRVVSGRESSREIRVFTVTSAAIFLWLLLLVAVYMSEREPGRVFDRYVFYVVPLMLISLLVWIQLDLPRPRRSTMAIAAAAWLLPAILPFNSLLDGSEWGTSSSAVGLVPWYVIRQLSALSGVGIVFLAIVLIITGRLAFIVYRSNAATSIVLIRMTVIYLASVGAIAQVANAVVATRASNLGVGLAAPDWIDKAVGRDANVSVIWTGVKHRSVYGWYTIWENEFFNRSVHTVYYLEDPVRYDLPQTKLERSGLNLVVPGGGAVRASYVLTDVTLPILGQTVATDSKAGMALYEVDGPIRLRGNVPNEPQTRLRQSLS